MRKSTLIQKIAASQEIFLLEDIALIINQILGYLRDSLAKKGRIEVRGFGNLTINHQKSRKARNPKTSEQVDVPEKYKLRFKMGKELKERLNSKSSL